MVDDTWLPGFGRFDFGAGFEVGICIDGCVWPVDALGLAARTTTDLFGRWDLAVSRLAEAAAGSLPAGTPLRKVQVGAPVEPTNLFQSGANYRSHVIQLRVAGGLRENPNADVDALRRQAAQMMDDRAANDQPYVFLGMTGSIAGAYDELVLPSLDGHPDWELELAVVIKQPAYRVSAAEALDYVAGYTICNDLTLRDRVFRGDLPSIGTDWLASKNAPGFSPLGPVLVPRDFVPDPQDLEISLRLNGDLMQDALTSDMVFPVARLIEYISENVKLLPGDVVMTGSPHGNGIHYGRFLKSGDVMDAAISGLGAQRTVVAAASR